ncbi:hypothetical protein LMH87_001181 [Akanthomyces muscarius]|uniref:Fibronectin type-III domain-containing protein n=1 Tax=Akanthomyces muscarius TaxID=2231603 RepID=A0A9W8UPI1_AKAMU|nr:hypothetical protein LMH87_001181 [Akanthomyces muscarius]KAJ4155961.1 hypothetical protein LMH87_001181 [Akanthomyces muscarius]
MRNQGHLSLRGVALQVLFAANAVAQTQAAVQAMPQPTLAIPMPSTVIDGVDYSILSKLAAQLPAVRTPEDSHNANNIAARRLDASSSGGVESRDGTLKVLIVGDSMSQGKEGDYTWRYRISQWFQSQNVGVDFVGPYKGTRPPPETKPPSAPALKGVKAADAGVLASGGYAAGISFDSDHFSIWGQACAEDVGLIRDVVQNGQPDVMLVMLGFNDLGWFYSDDKGLLHNMQTFISNARAAKPNIKIALANVPQRTSLGREDLPQKTTAYNKALVDAIPKWSTDESPIYLVKLQENYDCNLGGCPVGYDGLHPNAKGEYQIARAFSLTLANDMKIGSSPLEVPGNIPGRPVAVPSNFQVTSSPQGVTATWDKVYGTYGYNVRSRISGYTDWSVGNVAINRFDTHWPLDGYTYDIQVQSACGDGCAGDWTSVGSAVAKPQLASGPKNVEVSDGGSGTLHVTWDSSTGDYADSVSEYFVLTWDQTQPCAWIGGYAYQGNSAVVDGLVDGHEYFLAITAWNKNGEGFPNVLPNRVIGGGTPGTPPVPSIQAIDAATAHLTWNEVPGAAGYYLWTRNVNKAGDVSVRQNITRKGSCADVGLLFPGVWNYEFCLQAFNGDDTSPKGPCSTAPSPVKGAAIPSCTADGAKQSTGCAFNNIPTFTDPGPGSSMPTTTKGPSSQPTHLGPHPTGTESVLTPTDSIRPWQTVDCGNNAVTNLDRESGKTLWDALDTTKAWSDVTSFFIGDTERPETTEFTEDVARFFNITTTNWGCRKLEYHGDQACKIPIGCPDPNAPAGWVILNSIAGIERTISNLAGAISDSEASVSDQVGGIVDTFGNLPDGKVDAILGMVSLGLGFLAVPGFGDLLKELNTLRPKAGDAAAGLRDAVTNLAGQSTSIVKQTEAGDPTAISEGNSLKENVQGIIRLWEDTLKAYNDQLFNGSPESITSILHIIIDGATFASERPATIDLQKQVERAIFPQLIYQAWTLGKAPPFILDSGDDCKAGDPPPKKTPASKEGYACVNGKAYYLTSAPGTYYTNPNCYQHPVTQCTPTGYKTLPGQKSIDGKSYGNITIQDFVEGSVNTWNSRGQQNGGSNADDFASSIVGQIYDNPGAEFKIPGVFAIPVCKDSEAQFNWKEGRRSANFPCNPSK